MARLRFFTCVCKRDLKQDASRIVWEPVWRCLCRGFGVTTSQRKQFGLTHKDTFSRSHLTKQPTGSRTDTSLSALGTLFSEIVAPAVIKPGSRFLPFCRSNLSKGFWVKTVLYYTNTAVATPTSAGCRKSVLPLPSQQTQMQKWCGFGG